MNNGKISPLICNTKEVKGILDGSLTEFEMLMKNQPFQCNGEMVIESGNGWLAPQNIWAGRSPFGKRGGIRWIRESFITKKGKTIYRADDSTKTTEWKPPLNMTQEQSRISIEIVESSSRLKKDKWYWTTRFRVIEK